MTLKVDTFERDIAEEIKRKDASLTEISAASNNVGNEEAIPQKKSSVLIFVLLGVFVLALCGLAGVAYFYFTDPLLPPSQGSVAIKPADVPKINTDLMKLSPTLANQVGTFVTSVEKRERGYVVNISSYSSVFAYVTRNENAFISELALLFAPLATTTQAVSAPPVATTTYTIVGTTTQSGAKATTTQAAKTTAKPKQKQPTSTTTTATLPPSTTGTTSTNIQQTYLVEKEQIIDSRFSDVTLSNQNMRVWTSGNRRVVYSFFGTDKILISDSPEGILLLKSGILR